MNKKFSSLIIACLSLCSYKAFADMDGNVELCLNGNGKSCILAGHDYERINLDIKKAMIYYHHGCTIGYGLACLEEGIIYCNGRDEIVKDEVKGLNLVIKGCALNDPKTCYELALLHRDGKCSARKNRAQARYYLKKACAYDYKPGCDESVLDKK